MQQERRSLVLQEKARSRSSCCDLRSLLPCAIQGIRRIKCGRSLKFCTAEIHSLHGLLMQTLTPARCKWSPVHNLYRLLQTNPPSNHHLPHIHMRLPPSPVLPTPPLHQTRHHHLAPILILRTIQIPPFQRLRCRLPPRLVQTRPRVFP